MVLHNFSQFALLHQIQQNAKSKHRLRRNLGRKLVYRVELMSCISSNLAVNTLTHM